VNPAETSATQNKNHGNPRSAQSSPGPIGALAHPKHSSMLVLEEFNSCNDYTDYIWKKTGIGSFK
jgi:hypothetical protein